MFPTLESSGDPPVHAFSDTDFDSALGVQGEKIQSDPDVEWEPQPGPQTQAMLSEADELFYGGAAGGGKTDLLLGTAGTQHHHSIIFRRVFKSTRRMIERSREIFNYRGEDHKDDSYNESLHIWRLASGRIVEFGSLQFDKDKEKFRGQDHDLIGWDEITEFTEAQYRFVNAWNRSTREGQRCRIIATGNPPTDAAGEWVIQYWAPWLDPSHKNPAEPGELRWFAVIDGKDVEVDGPQEFEHTKADGETETIQPRSRTFIPARLEDNPILEKTGYRATLQNLPEPLRTQLLYGDMSIKPKDDPWQVIPSQWVIDAQDRFTRGERPQRPLVSVGSDPARGGEDEHAIAELYGYTWFELTTHEGAQTPDGPAGCAQIRDVVAGRDATVAIDVIGIGSSVYDFFAMEHEDTIPVNNSEAAPLNATDESGKLLFSNMRSFGYWMLREALNPKSGHDIALPDSRTLRIGLCTPKYSIVGGRIKVEPKKSIKERTGFSPDEADAIILSWLATILDRGDMEIDEQPDELKNWR